MSSRSPAELRARYERRSAAWLRENLHIFRGWKREEIEKLIAEKEGPSEEARRAHESLSLAWVSLAVTIVFGVVALLAWLWPR